MSPNPAEQFPDNDINTKGAHAGNPNVPDDVRETPAVEYNRPLGQAVQHDITIPDTYEEGWKNAPLSDEEKAAVQARLNPNTPPKNRNKVLAWVGGIAAGAAGIALAVGSLNAGASGEDKDKDGPTGTQPTVTAPVTPGGVAPTETAPTPTFEAPSKPTVVTPEAIPNYEELTNGAKIKDGEYEKANDIRTEFANQFTKMMNFQPTEDQLKASENYVSDKAALKGPEALAAQYREAFTSKLFSSDGQFQNTMESAAADTFKKWLKTRHEENPYEVTMKYNTETKLYEFTNNVNYNSEPDDPIGTTFMLTGDIKLSSLEFEGQDPKEAYYQMPGNSPFTKVGTIPNQ